MSTTVHGPGDPAPQAPEPQVEAESDEFSNLDVAAAEIPEDAAWEEDGALSAAAHDAGLFDPTPFKLPTPDFDGMPSDKLLVAFSGGIEYDPTDPAHIEEFEALSLGRPVQMLVSGYVATKAGAYKEDADGNVTVTGKAQIKIDSILPKD